MHLSRGLLAVIAGNACCWSLVFADQDKDIEPVPLLVSESPKLVAVWPADNAEDVDWDTELHLRFDRPIDPLSFDLQWIEGSYLECEQARYLADKNELLIPIRLESGCRHKIAINNSFGLRRTTPMLKGFVSADGELVDSVDWQFSTKAIPPPAQDQRPSVVSIEPPAGSKIARAALLRIRFDRPMDLTAFNPLRIGAIGAPEIEIGNPQHHGDSRELIIPIVLPANWTGEIELKGLRSEAGILAEPITIRYSTTDETFNPADTRRLERPDSLAKLRDVLGSMQKSRANLQSVSETVCTVRSSGRGIQGQGFSQLQANWTRFKMQGERQFYADVSRVMGMPFRIGSDGRQCWFFSHRRDDQGRKRPTLIASDYDQIGDKNLAFVDPFHLVRKGVDQSINDRNLQYIGVEKIGDIDCHLIRSSSARQIAEDMIWFFVEHWWIDSTTFRPVQVSGDFSGNKTQSRFQYDSLNQELPLSEFQPTVTDQTVRRGLEPLGEGYDRRFLKISDGANGRKLSLGQVRSKRYVEFRIELNGRALLTRAATFEVASFFV